MNYGIIFIETRNKPDLRRIFEDHIEFVPHLEPFVICSMENRHQFEGFNKLIIPNPGNNRAYNKLITDPFIWDNVPFDKALICEHDSGILREGIEEFYEWDWVGAPWKFQNHGGNGGFSWRNIEALRYISRNFRIGVENEDVFFCNAMRMTDWRLAPRDVCSEFSVETIWKLGTFGYHAIKSHFPNNYMDILNQYNNVIT